MHLEKMKEKNHFDFVSAKLLIEKEKSTQSREGMFKVTEVESFYIK